MALQQGAAAAASPFAASAAGAGTQALAFTSQPAQPVVIAWCVHEQQHPVLLHGTLAAACLDRAQRNRSFL